MELLTRYRVLCEKAGEFRASGAQAPRQLLEELSRLEAELHTRLWLASAEVPSNPATRRQNGDHQTSPSTDILQPAREIAIPSGKDSPGVRQATVFSDGACLGNPGPGGYAAIVRIPGYPDREIHGGKARTTNNEMELTAAIMGLKAAAALGATQITVISDSEYLVKGMTGWIQNWIRKGWKTTMGNPVKNRELWEELHKLSEGRMVSWSWTRGHSGHPENERCDTLASNAAREAASAPRRG